MESVLLKGVLCILIQNSLSIIGQNQPWVLTGKTDPEAEASILWPSHEKRNLPGKDPDVGKE